MLVPIIGLGWTLVVDVVVVAAALVGVVLFCRWLDAPRRELIDEIKRRPKVTIRWRSPDA